MSDSDHDDGSEILNEFFGNSNDGKDEEYLPIGQNDERLQKIEKCISLCDYVDPNYMTLCIDQCRYNE